MNKPKSPAKAVAVRRSRRKDLDGKGSDAAPKPLSDNPQGLAYWHQLESPSGDVWPRYRRD